MRRMAVTARLGEGEGRLLQVAGGMQPAVVFQ